MHRCGRGVESLSRHRLRCRKAGGAAGVACGTGFPELDDIDIARCLGWSGRLRQLEWPGEFRRRQILRTDDWRAGDAKPATGRDQGERSRGARNTLSFHEILSLGRANGITEVPGGLTGPLSLL